MKRNKRYYENKKIVNHYGKLTELQKPEGTFLTLFRRELKDMRFLDLGVGGGRTTLPFSSQVNEYVGVDYSNEMIQECKRKYGGLPNVIFEVGDARSLHQFPDGQFDLVLFSFNGIDEVAPEDRLVVLSEIKRVLRTNGHFFFSTHNLNFIKEKFSTSVWRAPRMFLMLRAINQDRRPPEVGSGLFDDGWWSLRFRMDTHYISPELQIKQLQDAGFEGMRAFSVATGNEITVMEDLYRSVEPWIYYLCTRS